jgi:hypothetical protein
VNSEGEEPITADMLAIAFQLKADGNNPAIPQFEVYDDSAISIKEASSQMESALVRNGFSSTSVSAGV